MSPSKRAPTARPCSGWRRNKAMCSTCRPGDALFQNTAYWGRHPRPVAPRRRCSTSPSGPASNVLSFRAQYNALAPVTYYGYVMETYVDPYVPIPVVTFTGTRLPPLAASPALNAGSVVSLDHSPGPMAGPGPRPGPGAHPGPGLDRRLDRRRRDRISRGGDHRLGAGAAGSRRGRRCAGTGADYDGLYYLKAVTHRIELLANEQWDYRQSLTLTREGVGSTVATVMAP